MTADKGLAGSFNANLIRAAELHGRQNENLAWYSVGIKSRFSSGSDTPALRSSSTVDLCAASSWAAFTAAWVRA